MASFNLLEKRNISSLEPPPDKYTIGAKDDKFGDIRMCYPSFSFEYACMDKDEFSFNYVGISPRDYAKLIDGLKNVSKHTYERLNAECCFHFHEVKWDAVTIRESDFYKCIAKGYKGEKDLTVYQFKVFEEARVFGFVYSGVFYAVLFDRQHKAYNRDRPTKMKRAGKKHPR